MTIFERCLQNKELGILFLFVTEYLNLKFWRGIENTNINHLHSRHFKWKNKIWKFFSHKTDALILGKKMHNVHLNIKDYKYRSVKTLTSYATPWFKVTALFLFLIDMFLWTRILNKHLLWPLTLYLLKFTAHPV